MNTAAEPLPHVPQFAPAPRGPTPGKPKPDLRYYAAHEPRAADAVLILAGALGLRSTDLAPYYLPYDFPRRWTLADTGTRAMWLGDWLRAEFLAVGDECRGTVTAPDPLHTVGTRD